jgi:hypothetical protein
MRSHRRLTYLFAVVSLWLLTADAGAQRDPLAAFTSGSLWRGSLSETTDTIGTLRYPIVLYVDVRRGDAFIGTTWYPSLANGLLKIAGEVDANGTLTFHEDDVVFGSGHVAAGSTYTGTLSGAMLSGTANYPNGTVGQFSVKLAE